jgi:hypothetical protein
MTIWNALANNWLSIFQTGVITGAVVFLGIAVWLEARARRVRNLIELTERHRDLWERMDERPELARILEADVNLSRNPVTPAEKNFVVFVLLHLSSTYYALRAGLFPKLHGLSKDVGLFFSLPIPNAIWTDVKAFQDERFVKFVDSCFQDSGGSRGTGNANVNRENVSGEVQNSTGQYTEKKNLRRRQRGGLSQQQAHQY